MVTGIEGVVTGAAGTRNGGQIQIVVQSRDARNVDPL